MELFDLLQRTGFHKSSTSQVLNNWDVRLNIWKSIGYAQLMLD
jgi:hypothetical protein